MLQIANQVGYKDLKSFGAACAAFVFPKSGSPPVESSHRSSECLWSANFSRQKLRNSAVPIDRPLYVWKKLRAVA